MKAAKYCVLALLLSLPWPAAAQGGPPPSPPPTGGPAGTPPAGQPGPDAPQQGGGRDVARDKILKAEIDAVGKSASDGRDWFTDFAVFCTYYIHKAAGIDPDRMTSSPAPGSENDGEPAQVRDYCKGQMDQAMAKWKQFDSTAKNFDPQWWDQKENRQALVKQLNDFWAAGKRATQSIERELGGRYNYTPPTDSCIRPDNQLYSLAGGVKCALCEKLSKE